MMRVLETREKSGRSLAHVTEKDLETTEGEGVDLLVQLSELVGWSLQSQVNDKETERTCLAYCLTNFVQHGLCFVYTLLT